MTVGAALGVSIGGQLFIDAQSRSTCSWEHRVQLNSQDAVSRAYKPLQRILIPKPTVGLADVFRVILERESQILGIIADNLSKAGWSWGCVSAVDSRGRTIFVADAHRGEGKRFILRGDEKLTAFVELESADRNLIQGDGVFIKPNIKRSTPHIPHRANNRSSRMRR